MSSLVDLPGKGSRMHPPDTGEAESAPPAARCPTCGGNDLVVLSCLASHRLSDVDPERPYALMYVLECRCGNVFSRQRTAVGGDEAGSRPRDPKDLR